MNFDYKLSNYNLSKVSLKSEIFNISMIICWSFSQRQVILYFNIKCTRANFIGDIMASNCYMKNEKQARRKFAKYKRTVRRKWKSCRNSIEAEPSHEVVAGDP